jgi:predicted DNA-binding transcriptional regulator YafY
MSSKVIYERFLWFHAKVKEKQYPNTRSLAEKFEISRKTAQRDIAFMQDRLCAPLCYVPERRGFAYADDAYELPGFWLSEEELTSLLISYRLASAIPDSALKNSLKSFLKQIMSRLSRPGSLPLSELSEKVSVKNIAYSRTAEKIFQIILESLLSSQTIVIDYRSPHTGELTRRDILPLHLLQYMGTWHIIAHCALKNEMRDFVLSRIRSVSSSSLKIVPHSSTAPVKEYIRRNFGIMNSSETFDVCLRFSPEIAAWVSEQIWHPAQQMQWENEKTLGLTFPVADFREVKREILKYGSQVEVVSPQKLREEVKQEIKKMGKTYR